MRYERPILHGKGSAARFLDVESSAANCVTDRPHIV